MELEFPVAEMFEASIWRVENIERLSVGQAFNAQLVNELDGLRRELRQYSQRIRNLEEEKRILEEDADDHIKRVARHEGDIFRLDEEIRQLRGVVKKLQDELVETRNNLTAQLEQTQNELVETRNNLTTQLQQTQNDLAELGEIVNQLQNNWSKYMALLHVWLSYNLAKAFKYSNTVSHFKHNIAKLWIQAENM